jgi:outer membrane protein OmpA-like peptidoglycan-associated protein
VIVGLAGPAGAQEAPAAGSVEAGLFMGGFLASNDHEFYDPFTSTWAEMNPVVGALGLRGAYYPLDFVGLEAETSFMPSVTAKGGNIMGLRGHVIGQYPMTVTPFALFGAGTMGVMSDEDAVGEDADTVMYAGAGARYKVWRSASVRADLRWIRAPKAFSYGGETSHFEFLLGGAWTFGLAAPEPAPAPAPEPEPEPAPEPAPEPVDTDNDGLTDDVDECKDKPEDDDGFEQEDGCPDLDNDQDTVADVEDKCPDQAGPAANKGCPDTDRDEDTVVDRLDNCPDEKGTVENQGCAEKQLVKLADDKVELDERVLFETLSAELKPESFPLLDNVAKVLEAHPEIERVEVAGHTDERGTGEFNNNLSQKRAEAVVAYLVDKGVDQNRLVAKGYGETQPRQDGDTDEARQANRRVEFTILD